MGFAFVVVTVGLRVCVNVDTVWLCGHRCVCVFAGREVLRTHPFVNDTTLYRAQALFIKVGS